MEWAQPLSGDAGKLFTVARLLRKLLADHTLSTVLNEVGDVEVDAARNAFAAAERSLDPHPHLYEAIGHLRSAAAASIRAARKRRMLGLRKASFRTRIAAYRRAVLAFYLMACGYFYLGDRANGLDACDYLDDLTDPLFDALLDEIAETAARRNGATAAMESMGDFTTRYTRDETDRDAERQREDARDEIATIEARARDLRSALVSGSGDPLDARTDGIYPSVP